VQLWLQATNPQKKNICFLSLSRFSMSGIPAPYAPCITKSQFHVGNGSGRYFVHGANAGEKITYLTEYITKTGLFWDDSPCHHLWTMTAVVRSPQHKSLRWWAVHPPKIILIGIIQGSHLPSKNTKTTNQARIGFNMFQQSPLQPSDINPESHSSFLKSTWRFNPSNQSNYLTIAEKPPVFPIIKI